MAAQIAALGLRVSLNLNVLVLFFDGVLGLKRMCLLGWKLFRGPRRLKCRHLCLRLRPSAFQLNCTREADGNSSAA
jgi:hypothetical protein